MAALPYSGIAAGDADNSTAAVIAHNTSLLALAVSGIHLSMGVFLPKINPSASGHASFATVKSDNPSGASIVPE